VSAEAWNAEAWLPRMECGSLASAFLTGELVAHAVDRKNEAGVGGIGFEFVAQAADMDVDAAGNDIFFGAPDLFHEPLPREDDARMGGQAVQQVELQAR